jgi:hypothetical protein
LFLLNYQNKGGQLVKRFVIFVTFFLLCLIPATLNGGTVEVQGKAWLDAQKDPAAISVDGTWISEEFGDLHLSQDAGSREVSGVGDGYGLTGVVSGKSLYLLFTSGRTVEYCAVLSSGSGNNLVGSYSNRLSRLRFGAGLCQEKSRPMYMTKK